MVIRSLGSSAAVAAFLVAVGVAPGHVAAQSGLIAQPKIGTVMTFAGYDSAGNTEGEVVKITGRVLLPHTTQANVYYLVEMSGDDSEQIVLRVSHTAPEVFMYYLGTDYLQFQVAPVGTSWELDTPGDVYTMEILEDGISLTLPAGTFDDLIKIGSRSSTWNDPAHPWEAVTYFSPETGWPVVTVNWDWPHPPRVEYLVSIDSKP
jgi:hypothetical protein